MKDLQITIVKENWRGSFPWVLYVNGDVIDMYESKAEAVKDLCSEPGRQVVNCYVNKTDDLPRFKLEVGKTYRSRDGHHTTIVQYAKRLVHPFIGNDGFNYGENGCVLFNGAPHPKDLMEKTE